MKLNTSVHNVIHLGVQFGYDYITMLLLCILFELCNVAMFWDIFQHLYKAHVFLMVVSLDVSQMLSLDA